MRPGTQSLSVFEGVEPLTVMGTIWIFRSWNKTKYCIIIGVGGFRILGGGGGKVKNIGEAKGGSQQAHDVVTTSMRRNDVASTTSFRRHVPTRFLINQSQIITFLIFKSDIIENSRI